MISLIRVSVASMCVVILAGCAAGTPPTARLPPLRPRVINGVLYLPAAMTTREYFAESRDLALSPGAAWPAHPIEYVRGHVPMFYEKGFGRQSADFYWFCSWARSAVNARDAAIRDQAMLIMPEIMRLPYYTSTLPKVGRIMLQKAISTAERGSMSKLVTEIDTNCPMTFRENSKSASTPTRRA